MVTLREAAQQALAYLDGAAYAFDAAADGRSVNFEGYAKSLREAITALRAALESDDTEMLLRQHRFEIGQLRAALAEPDLNHCPNCGGIADNGHDRSIPPNPYWCSKCTAEPAKPVAFFTEANGFPQTFVSKDRQKQAIASLTDQCAALIQERDELQKQVWLYEKNGVTCQTYRHTVEQSCTECNVQMNYTEHTPRKPLTDEEIVDIWAGVSTGYDDQINIIELARAIEAAHGITGDSK